MKINKQTPQFSTSSNPTNAEQVANAKNVANATYGVLRPLIRNQLKNRPKNTVKINENPYASVLTIPGTTTNYTTTNSNNNPYEKMKLNVPYDTNPKYVEMSAKTPHNTHYETITNTPSQLLPLLPIIEYLLENDNNKRLEIFKNFEYNPSLLKNPDTLKKMFGDNIPESILNEMKKLGKNEIKQIIKNVSKKLLMRFLLSPSVESNSDRYIYKNVGRFEKFRQILLHNNENNVDVIAFKFNQKIAKILVNLTQNLNRIELEQIFIECEKNINENFLQIQLNQEKIQSRYAVSPYSSYTPSPKLKEAFEISNMSIKRQPVIPLTRKEQLSKMQRLYNNKQGHYY